MNKVILSLAILAIGYSTVQSQTNKTTGPDKGSLVIVGGGSIDDSILEKFIELAGGPGASIVVIPTASGANNYSQDAGISRSLRRLGVSKVTVLHTSDPKEADTEVFTKPLAEASGVWFGGGRQWRLVDAYQATRAEKLFWEILDKGGVIGGSSAGATIQGSYLARGDTKNNQIMMGNHEKGFGFIKNIAIDQHVIARNRHFDMFDILKNRPELLGISIDEGTGVIVQGNEFEVMGRGYVIIFDGTFWSREGSDLKTLPPENQLFYFLKEGDKYDLENRKVVE